MKGFIAALSILASPAAAYAGNCGHCHGSGASTALALLFMGGVAALGYWVLRHAVKDSHYVRYAGLIVGWSLVVGGLLGLLCGIWSHARYASMDCKDCGMSRTSYMHHSRHWKGCDTMKFRGKMPNGHPPIGKMDK